MKLAEDIVRAIARELYDAEQTRRQTGLISSRYPEAGLAEAYEIQAHLVDLKNASGHRATGWKIGLTSRAMQDALKIDTPDSGVLFEDMCFACGANIPPHRFIQPRIEAEIAFVMKQDLDGSDRQPSEVDVMDATAYVCPVLEILDTRIFRMDPATSVPRTVVDTVADNAANAGYVLGQEKHAPGDHDLRRVGAIVSRNDCIEETGLGAGVLGDPATSVAWLARRLATCGEIIRSGDVVLSGSFIRPIEARPGDRFLADFGEFGSVEISFSRGG